MANKIVFSLPDDPALLAAVGRVAIRHGQLDHVLRMMVKTLTGITIEEALDATERQGSAALRGRVRKLAKQKLGEGEALVRLDALLARAGRVTKRRNELLHSLWAHQLDGQGVMRGDDGKWYDHPAIAELDALVSSLEEVAWELNGARLEGFLKEALESGNGARISPT